ncbi:MAG: radical SAM protein [Nanoarchaeota archaeon]
MVEKFNILLVVPRYPFDKTSVNKTNFRYQFPFGLGYISSILKKERYNVDILNLNHYDGTIEEIINKKLNIKKYDFVGTGGNALLYSIISKIRNIVSKHKTNPKFILGGPIITSEPKLVFRDIKPDFGVIGEGEETVIELLKNIEKNKDLKKVKGIIYYDKLGNIVLTERREVISDIESLPYPDFEGLNYKKVLNNAHANDFYFTQISDYPRVYPILGSRGCPFNCTFCYHEGRYRRRSVKHIIKEIREAIKKYDINIINLYDECFSVEKNRMYEFCKEIKKIREEYGKDIKWACQLSVGYTNKEMLDSMKDAGCFIVSYGFESINLKVLKSMRKPITPEQIENIFKETLKRKIGIQAFFIFGDIAETKESAKETLDWWKKNAKGQIGLGFIQPYPGSEIYLHCLKKGIIKDKEDYIKYKVSQNHWYNMTDSMTDKDISNLKKEILKSTAKYSRYIMPLYIKKMKEDSYELKVKCPFCKQTEHYKNCFIGNRISYGFYMTCRNCGMRFFIVSLIQKISYKYYSKTRILRDQYLKIKNYLIGKRV